MSQNDRGSPSDVPIILFVEDEPLIRLLGSDVLTEAGYRVIEAMNSDEALTLIEAKPETIAVVTDVRMSGNIDGFGLAHLVASRWPHVGIVITSAVALPGEGDVPPGCEFLPKPYQLSSLVAAVRKVTEQQARPFTVVRLPEGKG